MTSRADELKPRTLTDQVLGTIWQDTENSPYCPSLLTQQSLAQRLRIGAAFLQTAGRRGTQFSDWGMSDSTTLIRCFNSFKK